MEFLIADTFIDSLARLTGEEQKAVKTTAFDLQMNPALPGMKFHKLNKAKDKRFWSVRVTDDIRLIVHKTECCLVLCYVDHHDDAYLWAERRKLETHPKTGAAQLVEIREMVQQITIPKYITQEQLDLASDTLFNNLSDDILLSYGVPAEWLGCVREATEDSLLELASHLPNEAGEALLELAVGVIPPQISISIDENQNPFQHPDAQRRFRVMNNVEELERALEYPWEKWSVFLHPAQRQLVERDYNGPVRVSGSAGTGKTIVALHRAVYLARTNPEARVLLTTFSEILGNVLHNKLRVLVGNEPRIGERLEVLSLNAVGKRLYELNFGRQQIASPEQIQKLMLEACQEVDEYQFSLYVLMKEWDDVIDAWQLETWDGYRDVLRVGKKRRLSEKQRNKLWTVFEKMRSKLASRGLVTYSFIFNELAKSMASRKQPLYDFIVIDEAQDISLAQLRFLAVLGGDRSNSLFFTGDLGQRIFQAPYSWKSLGIDVRGRSRTLRINYRTSHQIRTQADRLLAPELSDVDGNFEVRKGTISIFNGSEPSIMSMDNVDSEIETVRDWLQDRINEGVKAHEIGVFVRSEAELIRACTAVETTGLMFKVLNNGLETTDDYVSISTMHLAKGLEFRAVVVMACDDEVIPSQERIEAATDESDLEEIYNTERHLLYVACTRARDYLLVSGVKPVSEFIDDLTMEDLQTGSTKISLF